MPVGSGAGSSFQNSDLLDPEPDPAENGPDPQPCRKVNYSYTQVFIPLISLLVRDHYLLSLMVEIICFPEKIDR